VPNRDRLLIILLALLAPLHLLAAEDVPSSEDIAQRLEALPESETAARETYREAIGVLEQVSTARENIAQLTSDAQSASARLEAIRRELAQPPANGRPEVPEDATLAQVEQRSAQITAELDAARTLVNELAVAAEQRQGRLTQIPDLIVKARQRLDDVNQLLVTNAQPVDPASQAKRTLLLTQRELATAELAALEAESVSYEARRDLLPARRDLAARRVSELEALASAWQTVVTEQRRREAEVAAARAERLRRQAAREHPVLLAYAEQSEALAAERTSRAGLPRRIATASEEVASLRAQVAEMRQQFAAVKRRVDTSGLNRATGLILRRQYDALIDTTDLERRVVSIQQEMEDAEYTLIERQDLRVGAGDTDQALQSLLAEIDASPEALADLEDVARELVNARRDLLDELVDDSSRYFLTLFELASANRELFELADEYESFIRERILWVRSIPGNRWPTIDDFSQALMWFVDGTSWSNTMRTVQAAIMRNLGLFIVSLSVVPLTFVMGRWARKRIKAIAGLVGRFQTDKLSLTFETVVLTALVALPIPTLLWWIGWVLSRPAEQTDVGVAVGTGLQAGAWRLFPLLYLATSLRSTGLACAHFRWPGQALSSLRAHLRWFIPTLIPLSAMIVAVDSHGDESAAGSLGRLCFTGAMVLIAVALQRCFRLDGPVLGDYLRKNQGGWSDRLRFLWYPVLVGVPLALIVLTWLGYYYTAREIEIRLEGTIGLILGVTLLNGVLLRWLFVTRRRVAIEDARRRRDQALAEAPSTPEGGPTESSLPPLDEDKVDLPAISLQTKQLFRTALFISMVVGLGVIWAEVLPALRMLDRVSLYPRIEVLESASISETLIETQAPPAQTSGGETSTPPVLTPLDATTLPTASEAESTVAIVSLADVGAALLVLLITFVAFRNLPGLAEMVVLQRLPLDAGSRYALSTVLRYAIAIVGILIAFGAINLSWSKVQWLAAALTFGLAFGLQEIFANFVSGLIILAERPVRIGDTVTVNGITGTVSRIRMRATTITDWERKELVIPNKNFITDQVINWTLSDAILRMTIPVGVSYGADVRKAEQILLHIASEQPIVLTDPKPYVVFSRFGDSTLDFELRIFIPHIDHLITVRHDMHMRVTEEFRKANIEIAFPQRDLHIRSIGELRDVMETPGKGNANTGGIIDAPET
jgi:potassium efflux system protein